MKKILKILLQTIIALLVIISIVVAVRYFEGYITRKNFIPIKAEIVFAVNTKTSRYSAATKLTIKYQLNGKNKQSTIIAPIYDYKKGEKITVYINPKDEKDIRVP
jgi:uncharacterized protein YxeA